MARSSNVIIEQVLNYILNSNNVDFIEKYDLTEEYFPGYENEFYFILDHFNKYGQVPDKMTFADEFEDFDFFSVNETEQYLYQEIFDLRFFNYVKETWDDIKDKIADNPRPAIDKFKQLLDQAPKYQSAQGIDIISEAQKRLESLTTKALDKRGYTIKTGFEELDDVLGGWNKGEEFAVIVGRTGNGKSWVLLKTLSEAFKNGYNVGFFSPEMSAEKVGFRFDTLYKQFANKTLNNTSIYNDEINFTRYKQYIGELSQISNKFIVASLQDFNKRVTISKLRSFIIKNNLDILGIDGITYMVDERAKRGDNKTIMLTNISEDLIALSNELQVPILVAVQSNRGGVKTEEEDGTPELENIRDSDGIAQNATKVLSVRQRQDRLDISIKKHRDGKVGDTFSYYWDINVGQFEYYNIERDKDSYREQKSMNTNRYKSVETNADNKDQRLKKVREF